MTSSITQLDEKITAGRMAHEPAAGGGTLRSLLTLVVLTLRQHLHGKRWMIMAILFLLPAGLALLVRATGEYALGVRVEFDFAFMFIPQALLPLVALVYASGMIQDEQEDQTITYLLVRPIPKPAIYLAKLLATLITTVVLTIVFTCLTYAAIYIGAENVPEHIVRRALTAAGIHSLAVVAYCCLFGLMSLYTKHTLIAGIIYAAVFEGLLANLPFGIRLITVIYYARLIAYRTIKFIMPAFGGPQDIAADAWQFDIRLDPKLLEHPTQSTCFAVLLIASLGFALLAAFLCSRREFHVKTPQAS